MGYLSASSPWRRSRGWTVARATVAAKPRSHRPAITRQRGAEKEDLPKPGQGRGAWGSGRPRRTPGRTPPTRRPPRPRRQRVGDQRQQDLHHQRRDLADHRGVNGAAPAPGVRKRRRPSCILHRGGGAPGFTAKPDARQDGRGAPPTPPSSYFDRLQRAPRATCSGPGQRLPSMMETLDGGRLLIAGHGPRRCSGGFRRAAAPTRTS